MSTKTQREFKKQMKTLEKEGKLPDSYYARRKRIVYGSGISILAVLYVLWYFGVPQILFGLISGVAHSTSEPYSPYKTSANILPLNYIPSVEGIRSDAVEIGNNIIYYVESDSYKALNVYDMSNQSMFTLELNGKVNEIKHITDVSHLNIGTDFLLVCDSKIYLFRLGGALESYGELDFSHVKEGALYSFKMGKDWDLLNDRIAYSLQEGLFISATSGEDEKLLCGHPEGYFYTNPRFILNNTKILCEIFNPISETGITGLAFVDTDTGNVTEYQDILALPKSNYTIAEDRYILTECTDGAEGSIFKRIDAWQLTDPLEIAHTTAAFLKTDKSRNTGIEMKNVMLGDSILYAFNFTDIKNNKKLGAASEFEAPVPYSAQGADSLRIIAATGDKYIIANINGSGYDLFLLTVPTSF